jgi:hypothetical protein
MCLLGASALGTVPFWFIGSEPRFIWGIPLWLLSSFAFTVLFAALVAFGIMRYWRDDRFE